MRTPLLLCLLAWTCGLCAASENPRPGVIPTLREWHGGSGSLILSNKTRIVVDPAQRAELEPVADVLISDLLEVAHLRLRLVFATKSVPGDISLSLNAEDKSLGKEGYRLDVADNAKVSASTSDGIFNSTRTLLQILALSNDRRSLPRGNIVDWPDYHERGFMLDVGRKFFDVKYLRDTVKFMAWFKMNDFQLHLNDNADDDYSGFRLKSDTFPGLANADGAYTRRQMEELQDLAAAYHVNITPEIDAPAHARSITKYRPDLGNPKLPKDHLDLANPNTQEFMNAIWKEFIPWFRSPVVHIGADEYNGGKGSAPLYKAYINATAAFIRSQGKQVRMWGGLKTAGNSDGVDRDIVVNLWYPGYHDPIAAVKDGYNLINTQDGYLYIVPFAGYYYQFLDTRDLYANWIPTSFGEEKLADHDPHMLGGMFAVWNDKGAFPYTFEDVHQLVQPAMPTLGEILWSGHPANARPYDGFAADAVRLGDGPGVHIASPKVVHEPGDLAFGKLAHASENPSGDFGVQTLVDGRAPTRWIVTAKKPQWASVDLGKPNSVSKVTLKWVPHSFAATYRISTSPDGEHWSTAYETALGKGGTESVSFAPVSARYVRLGCLKPGKRVGEYSLFALEIYQPKWSAGFSRHAERCFSPREEHRSHQGVLACAEAPRRRPAEG